MKEFQHYAIHANGELAFAGCAIHKNPTSRMARSMVRKWVAWAQKYVADNAGDYPLADSVRRLPSNPVVEIRLHPVGEPSACVSFQVKGDR